MDGQDTRTSRVPLSYQQRMQIDFEVVAEKPRMAVAYVLCVIFGVFGAHRFYVGDSQTGKTMLLIGITILGLPVTAVWAMADLFRIPRMIRGRAMEIRERLIAEAMVAAGAGSAA